MYKIIGADNKEYGPVTAEQIRQWIKENRANDLTKVRLESEEGWKALKDIPEFAAEFASPPPAMPPLGSPTPPPIPAVSLLDLLGRGCQIDPIQCVNRGWILFQANVGLLIGANLLAFLILMGCNFIPFLGMIVNLVVTGPLYGGIYYLYLKLIRGQPATVSEVFEGFNRAFVPLMLAQIVVSVLTMISAVVFICAVLFAAFLHRGIGLVFVVPLGIIGIIPAIYLAVSWVYTLPLVIDKGMDFWPAMELSRRKIGQNWWQMFVLVFVGGLVAAAGVLACGVGLLVTIPVYLGALMYAYEDIFGPDAGQTH